MCGAGAIRPAAPRPSHQQLYTDVISLLCGRHSCISFKAEKMQRLNILHECLAAIEAWMGSNLLQLNAAKTEVLIIA